MKGIYLATSALIAEKFDAQRTIEETKKNGFLGVQLFINPDYRVVGYSDLISELINSAQLGLVVHLPNIEVCDPADIMVAETFAAKVKNTLFITHYLPATQLPEVKGAKVGWENSKNIPDFNHIAEVQRKVSRDKTFFVFDFLRFMNTEDEKMKIKVIDFIRTTLESLRPGIDLIHIADKKSWECGFRDRGCMCALGQGIVTEFLPDIDRFLLQGGKIIFEYENLQMAIESLKVFK